MQLDPLVTVAMNASPPAGKGDLQIKSVHLDAVFNRIFAAIEPSEWEDQPDSALPVFGQPDPHVEPSATTENTVAMSSRPQDAEMTQREIPSDLAITEGAESATNLPQLGTERSLSDALGGVANVHDFREKSAIGLPASAEQRGRPFSQNQRVNAPETAGKNLNATDRIAPELFRLQSGGSQPSDEFDLIRRHKPETTVQTVREKPETQPSFEVLEDKKAGPILPIARRPDVEPAVTILNRNGKGLQSDPPNPRPLGRQERAPADIPAGQRAAPQLHAAEPPNSESLPFKLSKTELRQSGASIRELEIPDLSMVAAEKPGNPAQASQGVKLSQARMVPPYEIVSAVLVSSVLMTEAAVAGATLPEELGVIAPTAPTGSSDIRMATASLARADLPQTVARQLIEVIRSGPETPVEVSLNPEELGRVRVALSTQDSGIVSVSIAAERPETLALLKRHIDLMAQDFQSLGYSGAEFSFSEDNRSWGANGQSQDKPSPAGQEDILSDLPPESPLLLQTTGLDLRL